MRQAEPMDAAGVDLLVDAIAAGADLVPEIERFGPPPPPLRGRAARARCAGGRAARAGALRGRG